MRFRSLLAVCAFPLAATAAVYGCSGEPAPEDLCAWLQNPDSVNCVAAFHEDIKDRCGAFDLATVTGTFNTRAALDMCVLTTKGGAVVFDPPIDVAQFPPLVPTTMKITNADGSACGEITYLSKFSWSLKIAAPLSGAGGGGTGSTSSTGGSSSESTYTHGTISVSNPREQTIQVSCPAPNLVPTGKVATAETHLFNTNQVLAATQDNGCPQYAEILPQAIFELDPGGVKRSGSLRLKIQFPPEAQKTTATTTGAGGGSTSSTGGAAATVAPEVVYYLDCAIPAAVQVCANGIKDASEVDIDCGGPESAPTCPARCSVGQLCIVDCDCDASTACVIDAQDGTKKCTTPATPPAARVCSGIICANGIKDGTETATDCGGACPPCANGKPCLVSTDCVENSCSGNICGPPRCDDKSTNGAETDVDCGGTCPTKCADGKMCKVATDCAGNGCFNDKCSPCGDLAQSGNETDLDCGGGTCPKCVDGKVCAAATDCASGRCEGNKCVSCIDGIQDGDESDVDCGGTKCAPCPESKKCNSSADCLYKVCDLTQVPNVCNTCKNGAVDGNEGDTDCGGTCLTKCAVGKTCKVNLDCTTNVCINKLCK